MATLEQNAEIAAVSSRGLRALLDMADEIQDGKKVGAALVEARSQLQAVKAEVDFLKKDASIAEAETRKMLIKAKETVEKAEAKAQMIVTAAELEKDKMQAAYTAEIDETLAEADKKLKDIDAEIESAMVRKQEIKTGMEKSQKELDTINAVLAEARAKIGA